MGELLRDWRAAKALSQLDLAARGQGLGPTSELRRDRPRQSQPGDAAAGSPRASRCRCASAIGCCWPAASRRSMPRPPVTRQEGPVLVAVGRSWAGHEPVPGRDRRPAVGTARRPTKPHWAPDSRPLTRPARTADQRAAGDAASRGPRAAGSRNLGEWQGTPAHPAAPGSVPSGDPELLRAARGAGRATRA